MRLVQKSMMRSYRKSMALLTSEKRYSPAVCIGCDRKVVSGDPDPKHVSYSYVERQNSTVRTNMRRCTRLSNGFSRKPENHAAATALNYFAENNLRRLVSPWNLGWELAF
jgi:hypothetical protein